MVTEPPYYSEVGRANYVGKGGRLMLLKKRKDARCMNA
jgi:hypothetical protein